MYTPLARLLPCWLGLGLCTACEPEPEQVPHRASRSSRYAKTAPVVAERDVSQRPEGSRAADVQRASAPTGAPDRAAASSAPSDTEALGGGPPITTNADILEAAALRRADWTPLGTRAQAIRCQAAIGEAALVFTPSWYAYDDHANPDTPIRGCERGESDSILEALPRGDGRTALCAIGWRAMVRPGTEYPYVGMGVRTAGNIEGIEAIRIETRSTGTPIEITAQLSMEEQEFLECGDAKKAPHEQRLRCDGTGEWVDHRLPISGFKPTYGKPDALDLSRVVALHFQNAPGYTGPLDCDVRISGVD